MTTRRRHRQKGGDPQVLPESFIHRKEEGLVLLDRAAKCASEVVLLKFGKASVAGSRGRIEEVSGVERAVPQVFERITMKLIGSVLTHHGHLAAHGHAVFSREVAGNDL